MPDVRMIGDKWGGMKGKVGVKKGMIQNSIYSKCFVHFRGMVKA